MIYAYGVSLPGTYNIKNDIVCQDSHRIIHCSNDMAIAAVADGVGSAKYSDVGSQIAVHVSTEHCRQYITAKSEEQQILAIMRAAFAAAFRTIEKEAAAKERPVDLYDTTLTLAVLIRDVLYYGHSGDSGMIALAASGYYEQVTVQQRDSEGRVFPLFFTDKWEFARYKNKVASVLLATDGMLETFFPIYIKNDPVNIHVSLAQFFMDNRALRIDKTGQQSVQARMSEILEKIPDEQVNDDKTIAVLINTSVKTKQLPKEYYQEPDWAALKEKYDEAWKRAAYPSLYKSKQNTAETALTAAKQTYGDFPVQQPGKMPKETAQSRLKPAAQRKSNRSNYLRVLIIATPMVVAIIALLVILITIQQSSGSTNNLTPTATTSSVLPVPPSDTPPAYVGSGIPDNDE